MPKTKEKCDSLVLSRSYLWMLWRCYGIPAVHYYYFCLVFLFRTNRKIEQSDENDFRQRYGNFFRKWHSESSLITAMIQVPSQQLQGTLTIAFWKIHYSWIIYRHRSTHVLELHQYFGKHHETKINESDWKKISWLHKHPGVHFEEQNWIDHVSLILYASFSLKLSFLSVDWLFFMIFK